MLFKSFFYKNQNKLHFISVINLHVEQCHKALKTLIDKWNIQWICKKFFIEKRCKSMYYALHTLRIASSCIGNRLIATICLSSTTSIISIERQWLYKHCTRLIPRESLALVWCCKYFFQPVDLFAPRDPPRVHKIPGVRVSCEMQRNSMCPKDIESHCGQTNLYSMERVPS